MAFQHPTGNIPKTVNLIGLGPTQSDYHQINHAQYDPIIPIADETWTMNKGIRTLRCHMAFILDDLVGECEQSDRYHQDIANFGEPIITTIIDHSVSGILPGCQLYSYPLHEIIDFFGLRFLNANFTVSLSHDQIRSAGKRVASYLKNSVPMILAYAGFIGVKKINIFGADYDFPGSKTHEADKANCEYWVGMLHGQGIEVNVTDRTTLLSMNQGRSIYGYGKRQPKL